jgi:predicted metal-dependent hydrolase
VVDAAAGAAAAADKSLAGGTSETPPETLPNLVLRGIEEFNRGEFFECHEYLEEAWMQESGRIRYLYQGILQVGVGFYHLQNGNWRGATGLLRNGTTRLKEFEPVTRGVDVTKLVSQSEHCLRQLETLGRERISEFDESKIPRVEHKK